VSSWKRLSQKKKREERGKKRGKTCSTNGVRKGEESIRRLSLEEELRNLSAQASSSGFRSDGQKDAARDGEKKGREPLRRRREKIAIIGGATPHKEEALSSYSKA